MEIRIKSFNGIGDLLFATPSFRVIKEAYPGVRILVNTNHPALLLGNPYVDRAFTDPTVCRYQTDDDGVFLNYPDPKHGNIPEKHHIISDWEIICAHYGLTTEQPALQPEIHVIKPTRTDKIRVQVEQKDNWHGKKSWPYFGEFIWLYGNELEPIGKLPTVRHLIHAVAESRAVVCIEGGISHLARAVGTPAVVIFGGFAHPRWSGYEDQVNLINEKPCGPCYNTSPCRTEPERVCMREITPDKVYGALQGLLRIDT